VGSLAAFLTVAAAISDGAFVRVDGNHFSVGDKPLSFVGANFDVMHGADARARAKETLDGAREDGLTVGRVWALGEGDAASTPWSRQHQLFRVGPDDWLDGGYAQLDQVLTLARARGLRVIVTLANYWDDFGGIRQYLAWAGLPAEGFGAHDRFFSDERVRAFYRAHLLRLVGRVNHISGVRYADDPTIFAWELMNESQVASPAGAAARRAWIEEMAGFIKSRDAHHLVTPGVIGYASRVERREWLEVCKLQAVDYCDSHLYAETTDRVTSLQRLQQYIDDRVQLARYVAHKPIVFGEFGFRTTQPAFLERPRADWFAAFLERVQYDGAAGALAWIYQPWIGHARDFGIYVDRRDTDDVRDTMRRYAAAAATPASARNPLLGEARGEALLYDPYVEEHRSRHQHIVDGVITIPPSAFTDGRWERLGSWGEGARAHAYGAGDGWFEYVFELPRAGATMLDRAPARRPTAARTSRCASTAYASARSTSSPTTARVATSACRSAGCAPGATRCGWRCPSAVKRPQPRMTTGGRGTPTAYASTATSARRSASSWRRRRAEYFARAPVHGAVREFSSACSPPAAFFSQRWTKIGAPPLPPPPAEPVGWRRLEALLFVGGAVHPRLGSAPPRRRCLQRRRRSPGSLPALAGVSLTPPPARSARASTG
jgi:mannan endo-1,4-beta-mannosidase